MNPLDRMLAFTRVAELSSFTQAATSLDLPKATVSTAVQQLEGQLGTRLLHRTTRRVQLTHDGQAFYERCKDMLADMEELQGMFQQQGTQPLSGRVRIDMSTGIASQIILPRLPELLDAHPQLEVEVGSTERRVDLVREGYDCVLRTGAVGDTGLIARPLGHLKMVNYVSAGYIERHGKPRKLADLAQHRLIHFAGTLGTRSAGFEYMDGDTDRRIAMKGAVTVNNAEAYAAACLAGLGIIQVPVTAMRQHFAQAGLVEVLPRFRARPMPLNLLYANRRNLPVRVRAVMDWIAEVVAQHLRRV